MWLYQPRRLNFRSFTNIPSWFDHVLVLSAFTIFFYLWFTLNEKLNKVKIVIFKDWRLVICAMCFDRFITILLQKSLKLSAMILGSLVLALQMLATEYFGFRDQYHACWCPGSLSHQDISRYAIDSVRYATCGVAPLVIWSSVEQNPTYEMWIHFYNLKTIQCVKS